MAMQRPIRMGVPTQVGCIYDAVCCSDGARLQRLSCNICVSHVVLLSQGVAVMLYKFLHIHMTWTYHQHVCVSVHVQLASDLASLMCAHATKTC